MSTTKEILEKLTLVSESSNTPSPAENKQESLSQRLITAIRDDEHDIVDKLLKENPDLINTKNEDNETLLHIAVYYDCYEIVVLLLSPLFKLNINAQNKKGETPLSYAITYNPLGDITAPLLEKGADPKIVNNNKNSAFHLVLKTDDVDTLKLLFNQRRLTQNAELQIPNELMSELHQYAKDHDSEECANYLEKKIEEAKKKEATDNNPTSATTVVTPVSPPVNQNQAPSYNA